MRMLTTSHLNRTLLLRQGLLDRVRRPLTAVVQRMGGIQNQYALNAYISLWSRVAGFRRRLLDEELNRRRLVQGTLMRGTIHVVAAADYPLFSAAIRSAQREWWQRIAQSRGLDDVPYEKLARHVTTLLAGGPRTRQELIGSLTDAGYRKEHWEGVAFYVDLVRVPPSGTWERRRADLYGLAGTWLGAEPAGEEEGAMLLVRRYLAAFGPAPPVDVAGWAGLPVGRIDAVLDRLPVRTFHAEDGTTLFDLPRAPIADSSLPAPPRFIPTWDAMLLVHARRTGVLPEDYRSHIFNTKNPQSLAAFLIDGKVAGSWRPEGGEILIEPFDRIPAGEMRRLEEEAAGLALLYAE